MPERVSPYALLKSSKPKPPASYVTPYDLYSAANQTPASFAHAAVPNTPAPQSIPLPRQAADAPAPSRIPAGRTHYIADIKSRHSHAAKRTQMTGAPISPQPPSSVQTPST